MPHPSKAARKARRRVQVQAKTRVGELEATIAKQHHAMGTLFERLLKESDQKAHLAKLVTFMVAAQGGAYKAPFEQFQNFPTTAKLQEMVDAENGEIILLSVLEEDDAPPPPKIELVAPEIVAPSDAQIEIVSR